MNFLKGNVVPSWKQELKKNPKLPIESLIGICLLYGLLFYFTKITSILYLIPSTVLMYHFVPGFRQTLAYFWWSLGRRMNAVVSPMVLGLIFYLIMTPYGLLFRIFHRDHLKLKWKHYHSLWRKNSHRYEPADLEHPF